MGARTTTEGDPMDFELDPQVRHAVEHPAETVRGPEDAQLRIRLAGEPARRALAAHWDGTAQGPAGEADRFAATVLLATLFDDRHYLERAASTPGDVPGCPSAPPRGLLELTRVPGARAAAAPVLQRPLLTGLLEWATRPLPDQPPIAVAEAARDLGIDDDGRVFREVRRRAERLMSGQYDGSPALERFVAVLREAEKRTRADGPALSGEVLPGAAGPAAAAPPSAPAGTPEAPRWAPGGVPPVGGPAGPSAPRAPMYGPPAGPPAPHPGRVEDDHPGALKNWGIFGLVIVGIILLLVFLL